MRYRKLSALGIALVLTLQMGCGATDIMGVDPSTQPSGPSFDIVAPAAPALSVCPQEPGGTGDLIPTVGAPSNSRYAVAYCP